MYKIKPKLKTVEYMKLDGIIFNKSNMPTQVANEIIRDKELQPSKQVDGWELETKDGAMLFHSSDMTKIKDDNKE